MVHTCFINGCHNRSDEPTMKRSFYAIPSVIKHQGEETLDSSTKRREAWIAAINRKDAVTKYSKVCSDHFVTGRPADLYNRTHPDWVPSLLLSEADRHSVLETENLKTDRKVDRYNRAKIRREKRKQHAAAEALLELSLNIEPELEDVINENVKERVSCKFILLGKLRTSDPPSDGYDSESTANSKSTANSESTAALQKEYQRLQEENQELRQKLAEFEFRPEAFEGNDKKVKYMTGLPGFTTLMAVFSLFSPHVSESALTKFQKYILVLMKLRLNTPVQDLAYRFGVSPSTISRTFLTGLHAMYERTKQFVFWPDREQLRKTMPLEFRRSFGLKVAVIIDCFELFIERPSNLRARAQTWSQYKHHNTVKYLIGITPQGSVSFLSKGWGGRASDKYITENSGFLNKLIPGDLVLADRGFDIKESVGLMCAEVKIPAFTKGKQQLSAQEVESTRNIAHVRIHVERVIGLVRNKYTILQDTIPIDYLLSDENSVPVIDKIVTVSSALTNLCESVVPFN